MNWSRGRVRTGRPTASLSPARPHRDGHHADRIIRRFRPHETLQTARDVTDPMMSLGSDARLRTPSLHSLNCWSQSRHWNR
jgi:hypothetical protein